MAARRLVARAFREAPSDDDIAQTFRKQWLVAFAFLAAGLFLATNPVLGSVGVIFSIVLNIVGWVLLLSVSLRSKRHRKQVNGK